MIGLLYNLKVGFGHLLTPDDMEACRRGHKKQDGRRSLFYSTRDGLYMVISVVPEDESLGGTIRYLYDSQGRLVYKMCPPDETRVYDPPGRLFGKRVSEPFRI